MDQTGYFSAYSQSGQLICKNRITQKRIARWLKHVLVTGFPDDDIHIS
nr:hypothetical protein CJLB15_00044 [Campylobacter phage CJLB-15]